MRIKLNQIYKQKGHDYYVIITGKRGGSKWLAKVLTRKFNVFNGTHSLNENTINHRYELIDKKYVQMFS
jgi:hypothetical protein